MCISIADVYGRMPFSRAGSIAFIVHDIFLEKNDMCINRRSAHNAEMDTRTSDPVLHFDIRRNFASYNVFVTKYEYVAMMTQYVFVASRKAAAMLERFGSDPNQAICIFDRDNDCRPIYTHFQAADVRDAVVDAVPRDIVSCGGAVFHCTPQDFGREYAIVDRFGELLGDLTDMEWYLVTKGKLRDTYVLVCHVKEHEYKDDARPPFRTWHARS
jgi:hypothetical protein